MGGRFLAAISALAIVPLAACGPNQQAVLHDAASKYQAAYGHYLERILRHLAVPARSGPDGTVDPSVTLQIRHDDLPAERADLQALEKELRTISFPRSLQKDVANLLLELDELVAFDGRLMTQATVSRGDISRADALSMDWQDASVKLQNDLGIQPPQMIQ